MPQIPRHLFSAPYPQRLISSLPPFRSRDRPPTAHIRPSTRRLGARPFTHNSQLLLVAAGRPVTRPQLPFLHHPSSIPRRSNGRPFQNYIQRTLLSTESKARWKQRLRWQLRFHAYFWPAFGLCVMVIAGVSHTKWEHDYPTPREWSFWSRWFMRSAKVAELEEGMRVERVLVDWGAVAWWYEGLLERLEDEKIDGGRILKQGDGGILVEGVGETGWDVSMKSEPWRRGYWECLMGCGRAGERLEGLVRRKGRRRKIEKHIPRECVVGDGNERPRPMPWGMGEVWMAEDVEEAFPPPEKFYLRVLTTKGFSTAQRVEAALAYADWCDFKGLPETAEKVLEWGMDIAIAGAEQQRDGAKSIVDSRTGIIKMADAVTSNILKVSTAMGVHFAQSEQVKKALPVFLSVLKARKELLPEPASTRKANEGQKQKRETGIWPYVYALKDWLIEAPFPAPPTSGDYRPFHSYSEACEEVGLMTYIGEILYATSSQEKGLTWTRDAVEAAEAVMWVMKEEDREEGKEKCQECLRTGLENWKKMAKSMAIAAETRERDLMLRVNDKKEQSSWFQFADRTQKDQIDAHQQSLKWQEEEAHIELRKQKTLPLVTALRPVKSGWFSV